jgi:peptidoglycan/xylan/chitin deacetylase (PgdA/CDA1 family)
MARLVRAVLWAVLVALVPVALAVPVGTGGAQLTLTDLYLGPANAAAPTVLTPTVVYTAGGDVPASVTLTLVGVDLSANPELAPLVATPASSVPGAVVSAAGGVVTAVLSWSLAPASCAPNAPIAVAGLYRVGLQVNVAPADGSSLPAVVVTLPAMLLVQDLGLGPRGLDWCGLGSVFSITHDDGPNGNPLGTTGIATLLANLNAPATFFLTGLLVNNTERCLRVQALVAQGHTIGSHTFSHPDITQLSDAALLAEIVQNDVWIRDCLGYSTRYFRPPYGKITPRQTQLLSSLGFSLSFWTWVVDDAPSNSTMLATYLTNLYSAYATTYPGTPAPSIVVNAHDYVGTLHMVYPVLVPYFRSLGYTFVTYQQCDTLCRNDPINVGAPLCKSLRQGGGLDRAWPFDTESGEPAAPLPWANPTPCVAATVAPMPTLPAAPASVTPNTAPPPPPVACILQQDGSLTVLPGLRVPSTRCIILYNDMYTYLADAMVNSIGAAASFSSSVVRGGSFFYVEVYNGTGTNCFASYVMYFMCTAAVNTTASNVPTLPPTTCVQQADGSLTVTPASLPGAQCVDLYDSTYRYLAQAAVGVSGSASFSASTIGTVPSFIVEGYADVGCSGPSFLAYVSCPRTIIPTNAPATNAPTSAPTQVAAAAVPATSTSTPTTGTPVPTTDTPTTPVPTTVTPTTAIPTTAPTTAVPTTASPTTATPTTAVPTTVTPTTAVPTTVTPTTLVPTTVRPTTPAPTTVRPTTPVPTTAVPITVRPTTATPTTVRPTTATPTTVRPTTATPTTVRPTTVRPTTVRPTTVRPTTVRPTTVRPTTKRPVRRDMDEAVAAEEEDVELYLQQTSPVESAAATTRGSAPVTLVQSLSLSMIITCAAAVLALAL